MFHAFPSLVDPLFQFRQDYHYHDFYMRVYAHTMEEALSVVRAIRKSSLQMNIGNLWWGPNVEMETCDLLCGLSRAYEEVDALTDVYELSERSALSAYFDTPEGYEAAPEHVRGVPHGSALGFDYTIDVPVPLTHQFLSVGVYGTESVNTFIHFVPHPDFQQLGPYSDSYLLTFYSRRVSFRDPSLRVSVPYKEYIVQDCRALRHDAGLYVDLFRCVAVIVEWTQPVSDACLHPCVTTDHGTLDVVAQTQTLSDDSVTVRCLCTVPPALDSDVAKDDVVRRLFVEPKRVPIDSIDSLQVEHVDRDALRLTVFIWNTLHRYGDLAAFHYHTEQAKHISE